jgi:hypothetical protein
MRSLQQLRWLSRVEGASLLLLICVAMPLKYLGGWPLGVRVLGSLHGAVSRLESHDARTVSPRWYDCAPQRASA